MRRIERAVPKTVQRAADPTEIRPKLRFLLSDEAREEGKMMVRNFRGYTLSRATDDTRSQFSAIARHIREGDYPNIAAADALMGGVLIESVEKIAGGFRQPEWMLWRSSWANALADGWPNRMEGAAIFMMTRDERFRPAIVDDETQMLPKTTIDAVHAGGGKISGKDKGWSPSRDEAIFRHYRDYIEYLLDAAGDDDTVRLVENAAVTERYSVYLALKSGKNGGAATIVARKGITPAARAGTTIQIDPTVSKTSLAAALSTEKMMRLARLLLTPGQVDPGVVLEFSEGLGNLPKIPYAEDSESAARSGQWTKPPSLDADLWKRIPHARRRDYIKAMAMGIRRGIHPDETVAELLAAA
ncbi:hypothetical protein N181_23215 [Sinorhizobium fredii USDA 205]|uniref:Uncharacterized protein n=1 Tax=Rhizobium fredii TaxID=380 RepID=A0A844A3J8_RHIFR|nr:hypothetical protein [Sinorhizobium fredii]KSV85572.1 hypothetical protein N181_23215 [Sinorhizobium fredii USDA 205]MQX06791.1 hypothetical protein [Sinorhizobium fredii]GEC34031.1 hypothetical protein EFR01_42020 [Sinorhizobium fredii]GLS06426.1 hypothetical protein GCM10007864_00500 [Sinorhizobium fredii]